MYFLLSKNHFSTQLPYHPRSFSSIPHFVQLHIVPHDVHTLPETSILIGLHFTVLYESLQRTPFENDSVVILGNIVEHLRIADEISNVNPVTVTVRLL